MTYTRRIILTCLLLLGIGTSISAQQIALKTNGLMWAALTPNIDFELVVGEHSSLDMSTFGHKNPYGIESKLIAFQPEYRYWFNGRPMIREYIGIAGLISRYDMTPKNFRYDGNAAGIGVTMGYSLALNKRLNLEFYGGFGAVFFSQKLYNKNESYEDYFPDGVEKTNSKGYKLLPIKLGVSISWIMK